MSEDGRNNVNDIMRMFFTQNLDKLVKQGRKINIKGSSNIKHQNSKFFHHANLKNSIANGPNNNENIIMVPAVENATILPQIKRNTRHSSRLSFIKRKELMELSRNREGREKENRFNPNFVA
jgi:hypothetical protein